MKHLHPMFGWILSDTLGIEEKDDKKKEQISAITEAKEPFKPKESYLDDIKKFFNEVSPLNEM